MTAAVAAAEAAAVVGRVFVTVVSAVKGVRVSGAENAMLVCFAGDDCCLFGDKACIICWLSTMVGCSICNEFGFVVLGKSIMSSTVIGTVKFSSSDVGNIFTAASVVVSSFCGDVVELGVCTSIRGSV